MGNGNAGTTIQGEGDAIERDTYNSAFQELGLGWHWDSATYEQLARSSECPAERIRQYLETRQSHLLRAYDAGFLVDAIQQRRTLRSGA